MGWHLLIVIAKVTILVAICCKTLVTVHLWYKKWWNISVSLKKIIQFLKKCQLHGWLWESISRGIHKSPRYPRHTNTFFQSNKLIPKPTWYSLRKQNLKWNHGLYKLSSASTWVLLTWIPLIETTNMRCNLLGNLHQELPKHRHRGHLESSSE